MLVLLFCLTQVGYGQNQTNCNKYKRTYALQGDNPLGITNTSHAYDSNPMTFSLIQAPLIGSRQQTLIFPQTLESGTTIYLKLGLNAGLLSLVGGASIQAKEGSQNRGDPQPVGGSILGLLAGNNDIIYKIVTSGKVDRIVVTIGGVLNLGPQLKLYGAWYIETTDVCPPSDIIDVLSGTRQLLDGVANVGGIRVDSILNAVDDDMGTAAILNTVVTVAAQATFDIAFSSISLPGDTVYIKVENTITTANLIGAFFVQLYLDDDPVGESLGYDGSVLKLLTGTGGQNIIFTIATVPYNRISIRYGGVLNAISQLKIYDIKRRPFLYTYPDANSKITICEGEQLNIGLNRACLSYEWYEQKTGGSPIHTSTYRPGMENNTPFITTNTGKRTYYIEHKRNGCHFGPPSRIPFTVDVTPKPGKPHVTITNVIN